MNTADERYDLLIIGGGSAGHNAAATAAQEGLKVALIEEASELGGLCILKGCMPTKTLIETANRARIMREANDFEIEATEPIIHVDALRERVHRLVAEFQSSRVESMKSGAYELIKGSASFVSANEILLRSSENGEQKIQAKTFIIATGSKIQIPEIPGLENTPYWTSDDAVAMEMIPEHVAVIGSGAIGMECAHLYEGLGSKVTVFSRREILRSMDKGIQESMYASSTERGITVHQHCSPESISHDGSNFQIDFSIDGSQNQLSCDALIVATGRIANTSELDLDNAGVTHKNGSIDFDQHCRTSQAHIFAAGDCASDVPVVHLAVIQGEVAAKNAAKYIAKTSEAELESVSENDYMLGLFTHPEVVQLGQTNEDDENVVAARYDFFDQGKGIIKNETHGFVKLFADRNSKKILGACAIGPEVVDSAHVVQFAVHSQMTVDEFLKLPFYHPTLIEIWSYVAEDLKEMLD